MFAAAGKDLELQGLVANAGASHPEEHDGGAGVRDPAEAESCSARTIGEPRSPHLARLKKAALLATGAACVALAVYAPHLLSSGRAPAGPPPPLGGPGPAARATGLAAEGYTQCPGHVDVEGIGALQLVNARVNVTEVDVLPGNTIAPKLEGRAYLADSCSAGLYDNTAYRAVPLLGKTLQYTVNLKGIGCGCNVAFYFTSMHKNDDPTACKDHYCDANKVCGARCDEVDVMEANALTWRSTLHVADDNNGMGAGLGGTGAHVQTWTAKEYGPGSSCIDTNKPFDIKAHFPAHDDGHLQGMMVELVQEHLDLAEGHCSLTATVDSYKFGGEDGIRELTSSVREGMVPIVSYWSSSAMGWLDGQDNVGENLCPKDAPEECPPTGPEMSNFQVHEFTGTFRESSNNLSREPHNSPNLWNSFGLAGGGEVDGKHYSPRQAFARAVELDPKDEYAWNSLGNEGGGHVGGEEYSAKHCFMQAVRLSPKFSGAWHGLGSAGGGEVGGKTYSVKECFAKALGLNATNTYAWNALGGAGGGEVAGERYSAMECFVKAIEADAGNAYAWTSLGNAGGGAVRGHGIYTAKQCFVKAVEADQKNTYAWTGLANKGGGHAGGEEYSTKDCYVLALMADPTNPYAWNGLGNQGGGKVGGKFYTKKASFINVLELDPTIFYAWQGLGHEGGGKVSGKSYTAGECFERAIVVQMKK